MATLPLAAPTKKLLKPWPLVAGTAMALVGLGQVVSAAG
jgi:hypothetical protein